MPLVLSVGDIGARLMYRNGEEKGRCGYEPLGLAKLTNGCRLIIDGILHVLIPRLYTLRLHRYLLRTARRLRP